MLTRRAPIVATADRPAELTPHTIDLFMVGFGRAPIPPIGEPGRWDLLLMSDAEARALYLRHREWLLKEAERRGLRRPWAERHYGGKERPSKDLNP